MVQQIYSNEQLEGVISRLERMKRFSVNPETSKLIEHELGALYLVGEDKTLDDEGNVYRYWTDGVVDQPRFTRELVATYSQKKENTRLWQKLKFVRNGSTIFKSQPRPFAISVELLKELCDENPAVDLDNVVGYTLKVTNPGNTHKNPGTLISKLELYQEAKSGGPDGKIIR